MSHLPTLPILVPLAAALLLLALHRRDIAVKRAIGLAASGLLVLGLPWLMAEARHPDTYALGDWPAPYGIILVLDPLAAIMVATTAILALAALLHASTGDDRRGQNFHALFQFQVMGLNGAFLTGDLFNLFVFFEILLIASYGLLMHGRGADRSRAAVHYVVLNLAASAVFLVALGLVYASLGTLNMADAGRAMAALEPSRQGLSAAALLLLVAVFGLKAAVFPLHYWLAGAYAAATPPVAALYAVMTKVGIYALLRVTGAVGAPVALGPYLGTGLVVMGGVTLVYGTLGAVAAGRLGQLIAHLIIASVGTLLIALGVGGGQATTALVYYLVHSTWVAGALFLLAGLVATARGRRSDRLVAGPYTGLAGSAGVLFAVAAVGMVGLPPFGGFLGKLMLLQATTAHPWQTSIWAVILVTGLLMILAATRAASIAFWRIDPSLEPGPTVTTGRLLPTGLLLAAMVAWAAAADPATDYAAQAAAWARDGTGWQSVVLPGP